MHTVPDAALAAPPHPHPSPCPLPHGAPLLRSRHVPIAFSRWMDEQYIITSPSSDDTLDLTVDDNHGRCNVIFVGITPSAAQTTQLTEYSQKYQVLVRKYSTLPNVAPHTYCCSSGAISSMSSSEAYTSCCICWA